jgi:hypothetical protein
MRFVARTSKVEKRKEKQDEEEVDYNTYRKNGRKDRLNNKQRDKAKGLKENVEDNEDYELEDED